MRYRAVVGCRMDRNGMAKGRAFGGDIANMAFRREWFLAHKGYADSLTVPCGEDDLLVDALAVKGRTGLVLEAPAAIVQDLPTRESLRGWRVAKRETLRHLSRHGRGFLWREGATSLFVYVLLLAFVVGVVVRGIALSVSPESYTMESMFADVVLGTCLLVTAIVPYRLLRSSVDVLGERRFNLWQLICGALSQPWRNWAAKRQRWHCRHDFERR